MAQKLFNTFHVNVTPKYIQQFIDRLVEKYNLTFTGDRITSTEKSTVFLSDISYGICTWSIYSPDGDVDIGMFMVEKRN